MSHLITIIAAAAIHVAPGGRDEWPGTAEQPLGSIEEAQLQSRQQGVKTILLHRGVYTVTRGIKLVKADSGLTLAAAPGERAVISGFQRLPHAGWKRESNDRVLDPAARAGVIEFDVPAPGFENLSGLSRRGFNVDEQRQPPPPRLYFGGQPLTVARWPDDSFVRIAKVLDPGPRRVDGPVFWQRGGTFAVDFDRMARWVKADDMWIDGILSDNWAWTYDRIAAITPAAKTITLTMGEVDGVRKEPWIHDAFFVENLPEELDQPGEYWIDRTHRKIFLLPPEGFDASSGAWLSWAPGPLLTVDGASHVTLQDLYFEGSRGDGLRVSGGTGVTFEDCEVRFCSGDGAVLDGKNLRVSRCHLHHLGGRGVWLRGGEFKTLTPSGNVVEDCDIHDVADWDRSYRPAVALEGIGHVVRHCALHSTPHMAVIIDGNDCTIEGCDVHHTCERFGDMTAVYLSSGEHPERRGNVVTRNFFHDIGVENPAGSPPGLASRGAVYADRGTMGLTVTKNVFQRIGDGPDDWAVMNHGGRDVVVEDNTFIDCPLPFHLAWWFNGKGRDELEPFRKGWRQFLAAPAGQAALRRYPELSKFQDEDAVFPPRNSFAHNVIASPKIALADPAGFTVAFGPGEKLRSADNRILPVAPAVVAAEFGVRGRPQEAVDQ